MWRPWADGAGETGWSSGYRHRLWNCCHHGLESRLCHLILAQLCKPTDLQFLLGKAIVMTTGSQGGGTDHMRWQGGSARPARHRGGIQTLASGVLAVTADVMLTRVSSSSHSRRRECQHPTIPHSRSRVSPLTPNRHTSTALPSCLTSGRSDDCQARTLSIKS